MSPIIGTFYFKQTNSGNLIGEFTNNKMSGISTESSNITTCEKNEFVGIYNTTWLEDKKCQNLTLKIEIKENTKNGIYKLYWLDVNEVEKFKGLGFIVEKKLIGYYTDE